MRLRFVRCTQRTEQPATLSACSSGKQQEQLSIGVHLCSDASCPIRRDGGWQRGLKDTKKAMNKDGNMFWVGNVKDKEFRECVVLA